MVRLIIAKNRITANQISPDVKDLLSPARPSDVLLSGVIFHWRNMLARVFVGHDFWCWPAERVNA
jgi:hypothetical protein